MVIMLWLVFLFSLALAILAERNFRLALGFFICLLPTYLIRFNIGPLPTTLLEVSFGVIFLVWLVKYSKADWQKMAETIKLYKYFFIFLFVFFLASVIGILASDMWWASLWQWRAYFLEPILFFFVLLGRREELKKNDIIWYLFLSSLSISLVAIIQRITGQLYPPSLWDDQLFGRATSFFTTPNAIGLYLGPIVILAAYLITTYFKVRKPFFHHKEVAIFLLLSATVLLSLTAVFFSFSQGAWIALGAGMIYFLYSVGYKKVAWIVVLASVGAALIAPQIRSAVFFQDQAGQNRLTLWQHTKDYLLQSPQNFIFGAGIRQYFRKVEKPYYNPQELERLIYPHNIFLNFWTETGLLGMVGFIGLLIYGFYEAWQKRKEDKMLAASVMAALVVILVHGLVDVPYFKNDLSFLFWIIMILIF